MVLYKIEVVYVIRIAIVDDEEAICEQIERLLQQCSEEMRINLQIEIFYSGESLISELKKNQKFDLIFLDIELYQYNGIDVGRFIRDELCDDSTQIAFISGKNGYDRLLFEFRPIHFIEKPATLGKIMNVITKYARIYGQQGDVFKYKINRDNFFVDINKILYFKSEDRQVIFISRDESETFYGSIDKIAQQLKKKGFFIPHRSYLVNYRFVKCFQIKKIIMTNHDEIPIADNRREDVFKIQIMLENGGKFYGL